MKIIRYLNPQGKEGWAAQQPDGTALAIRGDIFASFDVTREPAQVAKLLAPLVPATILCIGLNYRAHADESGHPYPEYPVLFIKAGNALQNPGDPILIPTYLPSDQIDYEGELAVVIGRQCKNVTPEKALGFVLGYACANDVSARDWQREKGGSQWCRGKTFDTFAPLGPCLVTADEIPDPQVLRIRTAVSGEAMQDSNTGDMIFSVARLISFLSGSTTLHPGTVILTGTPPGVGMGRKPPRWLRPGDKVTVEIEKIGALTNPVEREKV